MNLEVLRTPSHPMYRKALTSITQVRSKSSRAPNFQQIGKSITGPAPQGKCFSTITFFHGDTSVTPPLCPGGLRAAVSINWSINNFAFFQWDAVTRISYFVLYKDEERILLPVKRTWNISDIQECEFPTGRRWLYSNLSQWTSVACTFLFFQFRPRDVLMSIFLLFFH